MYFFCPKYLHQDFIFLILLTLSKFTIFQKSQFIFSIVAVTQRPFILNHVINYKVNQGALDNKICEIVVFSIQIGCDYLRISTRKKNSQPVFSQDKNKIETNSYCSSHAIQGNQQFSMNKNHVMHTEVNSVIINGTGSISPFILEISF